MAATITGTDCTAIARTGTDTAALAWGSATVPAMAMAIARTGTDTAALAWGSVSASDAVINAGASSHDHPARLRCLLQGDGLIDGAILYGLELRVSKTVGLTTLAMVGRMMPRHLGRA